MNEESIERIAYYSRHLQMQYAIAAVSTGKIFPRIFKTETEAEEYISHRTDPNKWRVVCRDVVCGEWR